MKPIKKLSLAEDDVKLLVNTLDRRIQDLEIFWQDMMEQKQERTANIASIKIGKLQKLLECIKSQG
jgi:hypothetical protein